MPQEKRPKRRTPKHAGRGSPKFTPALRARFCELYAQGGSVRRHAKALGVSSVTVFEHARKDPQFRAAYEAAKELNLDALEDDIHVLACGGNLTAMFGVLRAHRPGKWRENHTMRVEDGGFAAAFAQAMQQGVAGDGSRATGDADRAGTAVH